MESRGPIGTLSSSSPERKREHEDEVPCGDGSRTVVLTARHLATAGVTSKWRKGGQLIADQTGPTLTISNASDPDATTSDRGVTTPCAVQFSLPAVVTLCRGDLNANGVVNTLHLTISHGRFGHPCQ